MSFVSSKGNILCRLIKIELYKIFAIINRAIKGLHCIGFPPVSAKPLPYPMLTYFQMEPREEIPLWMRGPQC